MAWCGKREMGSLYMPGLFWVAGAVAFRKIESIPVGTQETKPHRIARTITALVAVCVPLAQLGDFVWALRRYTVGLGPVLNPFAKVHGGWSPAVPAVALVLVTTLAAVFYSWWIVHLGRMSAMVALHGPELQSDEGFSSVDAGVSGPTH